MIPQKHVKNEQTGVSNEKLWTSFELEHWILLSDVGLQAFMMNKLNYLRIALFL